MFLFKVINIDCVMGQAGFDTQHSVCNRTYGKEEFFTSHTRFFFSNIFEQLIDHLLPAILPLI